jgi:hypothetical protein
VIKIRRKFMVKCYKPNMTNLKGKLGREIMAAIKNTPPSNHSKLNRLAEEGIKSVLAERKRDC